MYLLDSNILVYAVNKSAPFHTTAFKILEKIISNKIKGCLALQNLSEFFSIITNKKRVEHPISSKEAISEIQKYINTTTLLKISFTPSAMNLFCKLTTKHHIQGQKIYDLQLVATMLDNEIKNIITANDSDFKKYEEINTINPFNKNFDISKLEN